MKLDESATEELKHALKNSGEPEMSLSLGE